MSERTLSLARDTYDAWNRGDVEALVASVPEDFEFRMRGVVPGLPNLIQGRDGVRRLIDEWLSGPWEGWLRMEVEHLIDLPDDRVLGLITFRGTGRGSGVAVEQRYAHLITFRGEELAHVEGFVTWERALDEVEIEPSDLETAAGGQR